MLKVGHGFKCIAGECSKRTAESNHDQQPPARIKQHVLRGPDNKPAHDEAAHNIDEERSVRKNRAQFFGGEPAQEVTQVGADDGGARYGEEIFHDGVSPYKSFMDFVGVISLELTAACRRLWRTPSPAII